MSRAHDCPGYRPGLDVLPCDEFQQALYSFDTHSCPKARPFAHFWTAPMSTTFMRAGSLTT